MEFIKENKKLVIIAGALCLIALVAFVFGGSSTGTVSGNAKLDQSKKVKSNVGDTTIGGDNVQLDGVSAGGDFNLNMGKK